MKPAFRLDQHPRRAQPLLTAPPAGYFEHLPRRVMARVSPPATSAAPAWHWLRALPSVWRTSLASGALLAGFSAAFWLGGLGQLALSPTATLDAVPRGELVGYLLSNEASVEPTDLADFTAPTTGLSAGILRASPAEITDALDAQPTEDAPVL